MSSPQAAATIRSILVVDDDVEILRFLRETLTALAYCAVDTTPNPRYAFELALRKPYDLFLFDFQMPLVDGAVPYTFIRQVHDLGLTTPVRSAPPARAPVRPRRAARRARTARGAGRARAAVQAIHDPAAPGPGRSLPARRHPPRLTCCRHDFPFG